jgi:hypothetical protein
MKKLILFFALLRVLTMNSLSGEEPTGAEVYLLTCGPGTETYSVYGHSALRVVIPAQRSDLVYNWGVFDFSTPNFAWKFAKGRLDYMLDTQPYDSFLKDYFLEERWVMSQKFNLSNTEIQKLLSLITENLKPENVRYRYDFLYDNCSTRIRDLIEKAAGDSLLYPEPGLKRKMPSFRDLTGEFQKGYPWYRFGVDLLMGSPVDKKASFRDRMFLPLYLQSGLSELEVRSHDKMVPLLTNPEIVVKFSTPVKKEDFFTSPIFVFTLLLVVLIILTGVLRERRFNDILDIFIFSIFSLMAVLMVFFNFFTDHIQLRWNLNIIWLNPFIFLCLASLIFKKNWVIWFRLVFILALGYFLLSFFLPQKVDNSFVPFGGILILRSSIRAVYKWNPLTLPYLTEF